VGALAAGDMYRRGRGFGSKISLLVSRIAMNWKLEITNSIHAGYGKHINMESIDHLFC